MAIFLHKDIYPAEAVRRSLVAYRGIAKFSLGKKGKYISVSVKAKDPEEDAYIQNEFCNYVLSQVKES